MSGPLLGLAMSNESCSRRDLTKACGTGHRQSEGRFSYSGYSCWDSLPPSPPKEGMVVASHLWRRSAGQLGGRRWDQEPSGGLFCFTSLSLQSRRKHRQPERVPAPNGGQGLRASPEAGVEGRETRCSGPEKYPGHPLSRHGQPPSLLSSLLCAGCLVLRTAWPGRFRSG